MFQTLKSGPLLRFKNLKTNDRKRNGKDEEDNTFGDISMLLTEF